jgi:hypothetical protein
MDDSTSWNCSTNHIFEVHQMLEYENVSLAFIDLVLKKMPSNGFKPIVKEIPMNIYLLPLIGCDC